MIGIKKGAFLSFEFEGFQKDSDKKQKKVSYIIEVEDVNKGNYKLSFQEIKQPKSRKKSFESYSVWTSTDKFKLEARRLKMKVVKASDAKIKLKEVEKIQNLVKQKRTKTKT